MTKQQARQAWRMRAATALDRAPSQERLDIAVPGNEWREARLRITTALDLGASPHAQDVLYLEHAALYPA